VALALGLSGKDGDGKDALWRVEGCSAHPAKRGGQFDPKIEAGLDWLVGNIASRYETLAARVAADQALAEAARVAEKVERNRRVMIKVLKEKAFPAEGEPQESFSETDGFEFFAMELLVHDPQVPERTQVASNSWGLSLMAQRVARLVGFQKMAMIMCADMINPEAKTSKVTHSWDQVVSYVCDCREEAGLSRDL